jgi:hypothetical protein
MAGAKVTLTGHGRWDGVYNLDLDESPLTKREWHWIKEIANVRPAEFGEAARQGDPDIDVALAVITLIRAGKAPKQQYRELVEFFLDSEGEMTADQVPDEDDAGPPELSVTQQPTGNTSSGNETSSSDRSNSTGDGPQEIDLASTGLLS